MANENKAELVKVESWFDYSDWKPEAAKNARQAAERIRDTAKRTLQNAIAIGMELIAVVKSMPEGHSSSIGPIARRET
jgi:hypothetical protein